MLRRTADRLSAWARHVEGRGSVPSPQDLELIAGNVALKNLHAGRAGFVIGNGPSLQTQDLRPLADRVTFVANGFWRHPLMAEAADVGVDAWQPSYYSIIDPLYFDGSEAMAACFEKIRQRAMGCTFLVPTRALATVRRQGLLHIDRVRACLFQGDMNKGAACTCDLTGPIPHLQSVSLMGLLVGLYTGCNPIYLLGMDHDWLSRPVIQCDHFYPQVTVENHPVFEAIERQGAESYLENLEAMAVLYRSYHRVRELAAAMGVTIYNASRGGYLDVFERVSYETVVPEAAAGNEKPSDRSEDEPADISPPQAQKAEPATAATR